VVVFEALLLQEQGRLGVLEFNDVGFELDAFLLVVVAFVLVLVVFAVEVGYFVGHVVLAHFQLFVEDPLDVFSGVLVLVGGVVGIREVGFHVEVVLE